MLILLGLGAVLFLGFFLWDRGGLKAVGLRGNETERLREEYFRTVRMPRSEALKSLTRHMDGLHQRHPGHSELWYLRRVVSDLRRDRR
ncbi:MAG: hypothetical protein ABW123_09795 [Cystobacter sp.]